MLGLKVRPARQAAKACGRAISARRKQRKRVVLVFRDRGKRDKKSQGEEREYGRRVVYGMGRYKVIEARRLHAVGRTFPFFLPKQLKAHQTLIARAGLMLGELTALKTFRLQ